MGAAMTGTCLASLYAVRFDEVQDHTPQPINDAGRLCSQAARRVPREAYGRYKSCVFRREGAATKIAAWLRSANSLIRVEPCPNVPLVAETSRYRFMLKTSPLIAAKRNVSTRLRQLGSAISGASELQGGRR